MDAATRALVRERADNRCEYCLLRQEYCEFTHHIEHIISKQHGGRDAVDNLALACHRCNLKKGPNLMAADKQDDRVSTAHREKGPVHASDSPPSAASQWVKRRRVSPEII
ncbi:MAG: HNH endonuclease [Bryobacteraceae bacterium]